MRDAAIGFPSTERKTTMGYWPFTALRRQPTTVRGSKRTSAHASEGIRYLKPPRSQEEAGDAVRSARDSVLGGSAPLKGTGSGRGLPCPLDNRIPHLELRMKSYAQTEPDAKVLWKAGSLVEWRFCHYSRLNLLASSRNSRASQKAMTHLAQNKGTVRRVLRCTQNNA
jgi:hypothetical protein